MTLLFPSFSPVVAMPLPENGAEREIIKEEQRLCLLPSMNLNSTFCLTVCSLKERFHLASVTLLVFSSKSDAATASAHLHQARLFSLNGRRNLGELLL